MSSSITHDSIISRIYFTISAHRAQGTWTQAEEASYIEAAKKVAIIDKNSYTYECASPDCLTMLLVTSFRKGVEAVQKGVTCRHCSTNQSVIDLRSEYDKRDISGIDEWYSEFSYTPLLVTGDMLRRMPSGKHADLMSKWSKGVRARDHYTCCECGSHDGVQAHHIVARADMERDDIRTVMLSNGVSLCRVCHDKRHAS